MAASMASNTLTENDQYAKDVAISETPSSLESLTDHDDAAVKAAYRKADVRILLWYSFVYLIMRIHVSNITNTAIINIEEGDGIKKQLGNLSSSQWAWVLSIFYYPYMFFEPTSTLLLKRFTPSIWMSRIMITWGMSDTVSSPSSSTDVARHYLNVPRSNSKLCWHTDCEVLPWPGRSWLLSRRAVSSQLLVSCTKHTFAHRLLLCVWAVLGHDLRIAGLRHIIHERSWWTCWVASTFSSLVLPFCIADST